jgi:PAS domain S-box-containing protein
VGQRNTNTDLWDSLSTDLISIQVEDKIVFINTAGAKLLGAAGPEQLVGKPILDFVHPDDRAEFSTRVRQMTEEGAETWPHEEQWVRLDGSIINVAVAAMPLTYQNKLAVQFIACGITGRKQIKPVPQN